RIGNAGRERMHHGSAGRALLLRALVALDAAVVAVLGLALLPGELDAVDAAVALVEHGEVVDHAAAEPRAAGRIGPDPVEVRGDELLVLCRHRGSRRGERYRGNCKRAALHSRLLLRNGGPV